MTQRIAYDFAVLRAVPHPHLEWWVPVGVVVHARTADFLSARTLDDVERLRALVPDVDASLLVRYLRSWAEIAEGREEAGPLALLPPSERFHWLTSPRSDVLQCSPVHGGVCDDPRRVLAALWDEHVEACIGRIPP